WPQSQPRRADRMRDPRVETAGAKQQYDVETNGERQKPVKSDGGRTQGCRPSCACQIKKRGECGAAGRRTGPEHEIHQERRPEASGHGRWFPSVRTNSTICHRSDGSSSYAERGMCSVPLVMTA